MTLFLTALALAAPPQFTSEDVLWWVFLNKGAHPGKATKEQIGVMQNAHIQNFVRLFGLKKLCLAGPLADPTGFKRGIVVLTLTPGEKPLPHFGPDPYVGGGFMDVEASRLRVDFGKINTNISADAKIEENRLVYFVPTPGLRTSKDFKAVLDDYMKFLPTGATAGLRFAARSRDACSFESVALFKGKDEKPIRAWIDQHPCVRAGLWKAVIVPQWLGQGTLGNE